MWVQGKQVIPPSEAPPGILVSIPGPPPPTRVPSKTRTAVTEARAKLLEVAGQPATLLPSPVAVSRLVDAPPFSGAPHAWKPMTAYM